MTGQTLHRLEAAAVAKDGIALVTWAVHRTLDVDEPDFTVQEGPGSLYKLGEQLSNISIENVLPQLSPLSSGGIERVS